MGPFPPNRADRALSRRSGLDSEAGRTTRMTYLFVFGVGFLGGVFAACVFVALAVRWVVRHGERTEAARTAAQPVAPSEETPSFVSYTRSGQLPTQPNQAESRMLS